MDTTIMGYIRVILGLYWDNGKENGNYYTGLYRAWATRPRDFGLRDLGFRLLGFGFRV